MIKSEKVDEALKLLEKNKDEVLALGKSMMKAYGGALYPVDILANGAIKRFLSTSSAFRLLVEAMNLVSSRALLRIHLDTAMRFHAVWLVEDPHKFAGNVLSGKQINRMKDRNGKKLTDSYLSSKLSTEYPWVKTVYENLCGYVHFSSQHLFAPIKNVNEKERSVLWEISEKDTNYPEFSWVEIADCFNETSSIFLKYLYGWIYTKANPEKVEELKQKNS
jgi:hypothetical protein